MREDVAQQINRTLKKVEDVLILGYGGSHAYGTAVEGSDIDIRGIYRNPASELVGVYPDSEQYIDKESDTVVYSLKKAVKLLLSCNPNAIEILGLRKQDYFYISEEGKLLIRNAWLFLSKKAIYTFGGYARSQLNRLVNRSGRGRDEIAKNESRSITGALEGIKNRYKDIEKNPFLAREQDGNVFLTMRFENMPVENVLSILNEISVIHKDYAKSSRNNKAISAQKLNKHSMHLIRIFMMGIDILEKRELVTYRSGSDHDLLMRIRRGEFLEKDGCTPTQDFQALVSEYEARFREAAAKTSLPDEPDYAAINSLVMQVNNMRS